MKAWADGKNEDFEQAGQWEEVEVLKSAEVVSFVVARRQHLH